MCGIAGFVAPPGCPTNEQLQRIAVRRMSASMSARGPDAEGLWVGEGVVLGHRRLAIIDLDSRSNQPMSFADGRYVLVFNGEIYNYRQLRAELEGLGEVFHTTSDSEVLLSLYSRMRERMLPQLRGMFAFAIWDSQLRELFLARDPYGIKPLYYARTKEGVLFASQVRALIASDLISTEIEPAGMAGFYLWGSVPEPWTILRGVMSLPAGSWMRIRSSIPSSPTMWHNIRESWNQAQIRCTEEEVRESVRSAVTDSVAAHLVADVPVSVFLSGGIDSGAIIGLTSQLGAKVEGVTIGFKEFERVEQDEAPVAASIASHYGFNHHIRHVKRAEFEEDLPRFVDAMDQPTIDGLNTWFASKAVAERGYKVVLSGVGGDELFYGYRIAREIPRLSRLTRPIAQFPGGRGLTRALVNALPVGKFHPKLQGVAEFMGSIEGEYFLKRGLFLPSELPQLMGTEAAREGLERLGGFPPGMIDTEAVNAEGAICLMDSTLYMRNQLLRDSDWASMAHSLELRTPLVDAVLLKAVEGLHTSFSGGRGKRFLAKAPLDPLPLKVINRPKTGFSVPMTEWLASAGGSSEWGLRPWTTTKEPWTRQWARIVMNAFLKSTKPKDIHLTGIPEAGPDIAKKGYEYAARTGTAE
jgi:asparagine synthase (glutamine-hydrolysing)